MASPCISVVPDADRPSWGGAVAVVGVAPVGAAFGGGGGGTHTFCPDEAAPVKPMLPHGCDTPPQA
eukprot:6978552-Prorocentrum_lima.AAC.1